MHGHSLIPDHPLFHVSHMLRYIATLYSLLQMARYQHYILYSDTDNLLPGYVQSMPHLYL